MRSLSKKVLAIFLSALMVISTTPFVSLTAYANAVTDADAIALKTAMESYEGMMDGTLYTNMLAAYNAYIDANEAYDAYVYGNGTTAQLTSAKTALETATSNMEVWSVPSFDAKAYHEGNEAKNAYSNVVYCTTTTNWSGSNGYNNSYTTIGSQKVKIAMPTNIVFAYDGKGDIYGPILFEHTRDGNHNTNTKWVGADDSNWEMRDYWYGYYNSNDQNYTMWPGEAKNSTNYDSYFGYSEASYQENETSNITSSRFYWNKLYFKGTPDTTNYYTKTYRQTFTMVGYQNNWGSSGNKTGTIYSDNTQYVINYEPALTQLTSTDSSSAVSKFTALIDSDGTIPVENYTLGGLSSLIGALDGLIASNPKNYNYSSNVESTVQTCANDIKTAVAAASSATATADAAGYVNLRAAISQAKQVYADGNDDNFYNTNLWNLFTTAYTNATSNMTNLPSNGYSPSAAAQTLADNLNTAYNNLVDSIQNVDTTALETAIDDAEYAIANSGYWTTTSYSNADLQNVIDTAKIAVWTSVDKYKSVRAKSQTTEETVAAQLTAVQTALVKLVINKNYNVASAGNYSANSVVAYATNTDNFVPADYANWATVETAVSAANQYDAAMGVYAANCATNKIKSYQVVIRNVLTALRGLKDAFSKMGNGEIISSGDDADYVTIEGTPESTGAGVNWRVNFWGKTNSIVFRTTHAADYLQLPDSYFSFVSDSSSNYGALDTMNIDDECTWVNQITSGGNETNQAVGDDKISEYGFAGGFVAKNNGTNTKDGRLVLGSASMAGAETKPGSGVYVDASRVAAAKYNVYAVENDSSSTWRTTADTVGEDNFYTVDLTQMLTNFDNTDQHKDDGNHGAKGALYAAGGTTQFKATTSLYVTQESSNTLKKTTKLTIDNYTFNDKQFGATYFWKYSSAGTFGYTYHGYRHDYTTYNRSVQVVNIADLFRLISECEEAGYVAAEYTNASWNTYVNALAAAKSDLDYSDKTAEWVLAQCQGRYDTLWDAKEALVKAADRTALIDARDAVKDIYDAGQQSEAYGGPWSDESWSAFANYYTNEVAAKLNGDYSATGVRNFAYYATGSTTTKSDAQLDIEARAARIVELKDALESNADFTPLDDAVAALRTKVTTGQFTKASIDAAKAALNNVDYFWLTDAQRKAIYASTQADDDIAAAVAAVTAAGDLLVPVDDAVVENSDDIASAAQAILQASNLDPDAYDYAAVQTLINSLVAKTTNVAVFENNSYYGQLLTAGYTWQHMSEVDAIVTEALSQNNKSYTVTITGVSDAANTTFTYDLGSGEVSTTGNTITVPYGTSVKITAPSNKYVNWYYTFTSATASNANEKYLTNDKEINFVINGDTTFRLDNETDVTSSEKVRVQYANNLRNKVYKTEYVDKGSIVLEEAPVIANYDFTGYTVDGTDYAVGATVSVTKNTMIIANYECQDEDGITIFIANLGGSIDGTVSFDASYNQKINVSYEGLSTAVQRGTGYVTIDDEQYNLSPTAANKNKTYNEGSIYAFTVITGELVEFDANEETEFERIFETRNEDEYVTPDDQLLDAETVLTYGNDYTFFASENMVIIPYTKAQYDAAITKGFINTDYVDANGATAFTSSNIINTGEKLSIVSNYVLPSGCELVESGLLMTATKDGTIPTADLTFKTVGTNGVVRMKSTQHTVGNQFVISPIKVTTALKGKTINAKYVAYVTYEDESGAQHTVLSQPKTASVIA